MIQPGLTGMGGMAATSTASRVDRVLASFFPKTINLYTPKPTSVSLSLSTPKPISISASFLSLKVSSPSFLPHVAVSDLELNRDVEEPKFSPTHRIFVGNLPYTVDSAQLAGLFVDAFDVQMAEVKYFEATGKSRGFGFVDMSSAVEAEEAARQFNGCELDGKVLTVRRYELLPPRSERAARSGLPKGGMKGDSSYRLFVAKLASDVDNLELKNLFRKYGNILDAYVVFDKDTGLSRNFGFVTYSSAAAMNKAIESLDGTELNGRSIRVTVAEPKPQGPQI